MSSSEGLVASADTGDRLETLKALRGFLARQVEACESGRDVAALSQRLMDVLAQISEIEKLLPAKKGTALDELQRRRSEKQQAPRAKGSAVK